MKKLNTKQKIELIDAALNEFEGEKVESYICNKIAYHAKIKGFCKDGNAVNNQVLALKLIPELELIRPKDPMAIAKVSWFGPFQEYPGPRTQALLDLKKLLIEKAK